MANYDISVSNRNNTNENQNNYKTMTLNEFIQTYNSSSEKDTPIINDMILAMDKKMKMYNENNYVITSFDINKINIYEAKDSDGKLIFDAYYPDYAPVGPDTFTPKDNVFYLSCLAIGIYNNCLSYINPAKPKFLKENFNLFAENIPTELVAYYRGIIERGFSVYLNEFVESRNQQEIEKMKQEAERMKIEEEEKRKQAEKKEAPRIRNNDVWGTSDAAFSSVAFFPMIFLLLGVIIPIIFLIFS